MTGDYQYVSPELLEMGREELVARLLNESDDLARRVVRQRTDPGLLGWLSDELLGRGDSDERHARLLLVILPELWSRHPEGAVATLRHLLDAGSRPEAVVTAAREWVVNATLGELDHSYIGLSAWLMAQELQL